MADLNSDGQLDLVAHLVLHNDSDSTGKLESENFIVALINRNGHLEQPGKRYYEIGNDKEGFGEYIRNLPEALENIRVTNVRVKGNRIMVKWTSASAKDARSKTETSPHSARNAKNIKTATYATVIEITKHLAVQQRLNQKTHTRKLSMAFFRLILTWSRTRFARSLLEETTGCTLVAWMLWKLQASTQVW